MIARLAALLLAFASPAFAETQTPTRTAAQAEAERMAAQREAMKAFARFDGEWRGEAAAITTRGRFPMTQTERVGVLLDGTVRLVEGRAYDAAGKTLFNALAVISYDTEAKQYLWMTYSGGAAEPLKITPTDEGFTWSVEIAGGRMDYAAVVKNGVWRQTGEWVGTDGRPPIRTFEMTLRRLGDTAWPASGTVSSR